MTPTYNRAHLLTTCYTSLCRQTVKDFEWIIVDDGSRDDTEAVVKTFAEADFPVIYVKKENGGKHTALNASHPYIRGRYVLILDSDDYLTEDAVEQVVLRWEEWTLQEDIGMVIFLKGATTESPVCTVNDYGIPVDILRYSRNRITGNDCCEVIRTELFKQYPFPVFPGERFVAECALWNRVARTHQCVYVNEVIYICEYLEGGLSDSGRRMRIRNPLGGMFTSELRMVRKNYITQRVKYGLLYCCYGFFSGRTAGKILERARYKGMTALCLLPGWGMYLLWRKHLQ